MESAVRKLFSSGLAKSTNQVYQSGSNRYLKFCSSALLEPFPVSEQKLAFFVAKLYLEGLSSTTVKTYLCAVRYTQIAIGLGDPQIPSMPQLEYILKGIRKLSAKGDRTRRLPITPPILRQLRSVWEANLEYPDANMLWAASCMCFFGFLRSGEVVIPSDSAFDPSSHLSVGDVRVNDLSNPQFLEVNIKRSKTDPFRQGVRLYLGRSKSDVCPVAAILAYMVIRQSAPGPFFVFADGRYLTRVRFVAALRSALRSAGFHECGYAGHSFRIGAATTAAANGVPDSLIKTMGRWESSAYTLYIRTPRETLCSVAQSLMQ